MPLINSNEQNYSWEADNRSGNKKIRLLWNPKVYYHVHKRPPLVSDFPLSFIMILILSSHLHPSLPNILFPPCFPIKMLYKFLVTSKRATCSTYHFLLHFVILTMFGKQNDIYDISLFIFLQPLVISMILLNSSCKMYMYEDRLKS
jgi:hypothetical protein